MRRFLCGGSSGTERVGRQRPPYIRTPLRHSRRASTDRGVVAGSAGCRSALRTTRARAAGTVAWMPLTPPPPLALPHRLTDPAFARELSSLLRQARWGAARAEEVAATAARIPDRDPASWVSEWVWTAGEAWAGANRAAAQGPPPRAGSRYLQAAVYYGAALSQIARSAERARAGELWRRHRACWEEAVRLRGPAGQRIEVPYAGTTL